LTTAAGNILLLVMSGARLAFAVLLLPATAHGYAGDCAHLPAVSAELPQAVANDNRQRAGELRDGVLTARLVVTTTAWYPDGSGGCALSLPGFAEEGGFARVPGPLLRARAGTQIRVTIRNATSDTIAVEGFEARPVRELARTGVAPGETRELRFTPATPGTYHYGALAHRPGAAPVSHYAAAAGALIVDPAGAPEPEDRTFVLMRWLPYRTVAEAAAVLRTDPDRFFELNTVNGLSWPHTERLGLTQGDTVRWRVINLSADAHTMHLHGFFFRILSRGFLERDELLPPERQPLAVTENMHPRATLMLEWTPEEVGNWIFHCHLVRHMTVNQRLNRMPRPDAPLAALSHEHHAEHSMAGLIVGVTVHPRPGGAASAERTIERRIRLFASERGGVFGDRAGYAFVTQDDALEPARDSIRFPSSQLVLTRGERTEIIVHNRLSFPVSVHWHGLELESFFDGVAGWSGAGGRVAPAIAPGDSFVVRITPPRAGTFFYHVHGEHDRELASGLYGAFLVLEPGERFDPDRDRVFVVSEPGPASRFAAELPPWVNGNASPTPVELRNGRSYRLRFIGISANDLYVAWLERPDNSTERAPDEGLLRVAACGSLAASHPLETWTAIARDGAGYASSLVERGPACLVLSPGTAWDFEYTPQAAGELELVISVVHGPSGRTAGAARVPVRVRPY
jgi:manganese oxidase